ncbi:MAG: peptidoglycan DD-metalloendopeptidase family protein [Nitrospirae bacterium]|nr:peptidoglycan DD-metalloendopeptidase family protein [Nitrospirota bacterium]MBF0533796.1 peptidoglycan DD-metalloendopeptidase family protein [Nitrospirota bacterium]MBF0615495.1 peptidoglycan DD-metalloendopeptidase family protein [Nitrospirota bacterium]
MKIKMFYLFIFVFLLYGIDCHAEALKEKYKKIQDDIKANKEKLDKAKKKESSIMTDIERAGRELNKINSEIIRDRKKIKDLEDNIKVVKADIAKTTKAVQAVKKNLKRRFQLIQRYGYGLDRLIVVLNAEDFNELLKVNRYMARLTTTEYKQMKEYRDLSAKLSDKEKSLKGMYGDINQRNEQLVAAENSLVKKKQEHEHILSSVKKEQFKYASLLNELESTSKQIKEIIQRSDSDLSEQGNEFRSLKGSLPWPVRGQVSIPYGSHQDPQFKTPVFRYGIYISTNDNEKVRAVYEGKVVYADTFKGLGQVVILSHGLGYHTVYANLSSIAQKQGEYVKKGDMLGIAGASGVLNATGIYFEVRYKGKPVDPMQWLKQR